jgi:NAD(P)H-flavin reductase
MTEDNDWDGEKEKISPELIKKYVTDWKSQTYMVAGPPQMVEEIVKIISAMGIAGDNIITENFAGY